MESRRLRVLFLAEAATLAHVARPVVLARSLDPALFEVDFAWCPRFAKAFGELPFRVHTIDSMPSERFLDALARGTPLYDAETLRGYVRDDLALLDKVRPDVVVGDFRLSLSVSARLAKVRYLTITNAYWSPFARQRWPLPDLPMTRHLGVPLASILFRLAQPIAFALHTRPLNTIRREFGLPSLGLDLRRIYTDADEVLYADVPELVPTYDLPPTHHYVGPVVWSPTTRPDWWDQVPQDGDVIYVTLGSSGQSDVLEVVLNALARLPVTVLAATAGRVGVESRPPHLWVANYLPGQEAVARAKLVICNGGSPTTQQALTAGVPVLGIASNMDQHLNMGYVCQAGAGELLRAGSTTADAIGAASRRMLEDGRYAERAAGLREGLAPYNARNQLAAVLRGSEGR
jgi:UDP:flavonoid glycosyltransferase YjiC (YdhE family)